MSSTLTPTPLPLSVPASPPARTAIAPRFQSAQDWHRALGDVDESRILFDPWPGTATEDDMVRISDTERLVELLDGTLVEKALGSYESAIGFLIGKAVLDFVLRRKLGVVGGEQSMTRTRSGRVRMPDVCFTSFSRLPGGKISREAISAVVPDLVIEVLSAGNTALEIEQKLSELFDSGTRLAWVIDPRAETAEVYHKPGTPDATLHDGDSLDGEDVLPGFTLSLHELFHTYD